MQERIVITGIGMVVPLGKDPREVLRRIEAGESAAAPPTGFDAGPFACPVCAQVQGFQPQHHVREVKMIRLMNRDAQLAVAAAHLALADAGVAAGGCYQPEEIGLFGATGLAGLPLSELAPLVEASTGPDGRFESVRFGQAGLRSVSPLLSFKVLSNMPLCFVSICEDIQGPNGIYTPWEGQGAQALEAGILALESAEARCVLVGGCDVKTHELAFLSLQQQGVFRSWCESGLGVVPGEGAAFLVLEAAESAAARGARAYAQLDGFCLRTHRRGTKRNDTWCETLKGLNISSQRFGGLVAAANGDESAEQDERRAMSALQVTADSAIYPKKQAGDLFAAAAVLQVGLGALLAARFGERGLVNCFGHGSEQAAFVLDQP